MRDHDLGITRGVVVGQEIDGQPGESPVKILHRPELTKWERRVVAILGDFSREFPGEFLPAEELAEALGLFEYAGQNLTPSRATRNLRTLVNHLIEFHAIPVAPLPGVKGGYRLGLTREEVERAVGPQLRRVRTGMRKVSSLQGAAEILTEGMVQLTLDLPGKTPVEIHRVLGERLGAFGGPASLGQVKKALEMYQADPDRYAREIEDLAEQFGGLFVRATVLEEAEAALAQAQAAVARARQGSRAEAA